MSLKSLLAMLITGAAVLVAVAATKRFPLNLDTIHSLIPAAGVAGAFVFVYNLLKKFLFPTGGVPDVSAHSSTLYFQETNGNYTTRFWANTTIFSVRSRSGPRLDGKRTQYLQ
ncbi:hypothetical protein C8R43DRAFT_1139863 [Mycena crocata]|nr:hypothetical protein C8R43DRAFT_1139863 [Mycena crocata]